MAILNLLEFRRDLSAIFPVAGDKNLLRRTPKGALSQTWLRLLESPLHLFPFNVPCYMLRFHSY